MKSSSVERDEFSVVAWKWKVKWKWSDIRPILGIRALLLTHPKCTHTAVNTHTPWTHTQWQQWCSTVGVQCLAQGHLSHVIEGGESAVHSLPSPTIPAGPRLEPATLDYESDSLTTTPRWQGSSIPDRGGKIIPPARNGERECSGEWFWASLWWHH